MFRRLLSLLLVGALCSAVCPRPTVADSKDEKQVRFTEEVKRKIITLGVGEEARVMIKLRDNTKLKGYISEAGEDHFVVTDTKTGAATTIAYAQVKQAKGNNLSTGARIGIGIAIALGVIILIGAIFGRSD